MELYFVSISYLLALSVASLFACPDMCRCTGGTDGMKEVDCDRGGMTGGIPFQDIDTSIRILRISAPIDKENSLTIGPTLTNYQRLQEVHITRSNIPAIGKHTFWGTPSLMVLNLTHNNITQVLPHNFRGLDNLRELYLDYNAIDSMISGAFHHLTDLRILSLCGNHLMKLSARQFLKLGKLHTLHLSYNQFETLDPQVFKDVQALRTFSCRSCNLTTMNPHMFSLLPNLSYLDLGDNQFKYLDREAFLDLKNLLSLSIDGNHFPVVMEGTFHSQSKLQKLSLANSQIAKVTNHAFDNLTSLIELNLSYNKLETLESVTLEPVGETLRQLDISGNNIRIEEFAYVLQVTRKLKKLGVADLDMKDGIPLGLLAPVTGLKHLNISGNGLTSFPVELLYPVASLTSLDLSRNRLKALDERAMSRLTYVPSVYLHDNPWTCDSCHILPMLDETFKARWLHAAFCSTPESLKGRSVVGLSLNEISACDAILDYKRRSMFSTTAIEFAYIVAIAVAAFSIILIVAVLVGFLCNKRQHGAYDTGEERNVMAKKHKKKKKKTSKKVAVAIIDEIAMNSELKPLAMNLKS